MAEKISISEKIVNFKSSVSTLIEQRTKEVVYGYKVQDGSVLFDNTLEGQVAAMNPHQKVLEVTVKRKYGLVGKRDIKQVRDIRNRIVIVK